MANNKVVLGDGTTLIDLTYDSVTPESLEEGVTAHNRSGEQIVGTNRTPVATETVSGTVKLNPSESVTLNASGQLDVGGRLGAFSGTTGIFHSKDRAPRAVGDFSLLITDAIGMNLSSPRSIALVTGVNLTLTGSHTAGSTTYTVANNYANRIACSGIKYVALSEDSAKTSQIVEVISCTIGGSSFTPDSSQNSSTPITIKVAESANPDSATSSLRVFSGFSGGFCSELIGQCVGGDAGGACLFLGQRVFNKSGNVNIIIAADTYNQGNGNAIFGRMHISRKNRWFLSGTGHDTTNGRSEAGAAVGQYSKIDADTLFAVGNGTSQTVRSNGFEVRAVTGGGSGAVIQSPNGTNFMITVDDSGNLSTTALS